ncbi:MULTISPECIES: Zn-dependent hydrolase [unclassified Sporosarcina]|uniref:Zn-dependent hydrolase n=1 Tax=unclassified Sporosarcina TaxID=2647733 RepID=UPI0020404D04|nr:MULTISPECIES: Zn-dependent hydrolase [unclassified Sporosarcina]GKV64482.1 Zn-dependent hydrolase [Sporosarcina sp. NCCP-2331]GLB57514.1 Zn-dependent hydrolase [Sporosarcina sp. NCCP-2378]
MINPTRLWARLMELGEIGKQAGGGVTRFSFTEEERKAKALVSSYMAEAGMTVREDAVGNLIGRKEGRQQDAPAVLMGSHIDTVPNGGMFDGALGVLAGIEVVQTMSEQGISHDHPIEVIAFTDEEGSRFGFGMIGSRAIAGTLTDTDLEQRDENGMTIAQAMKDSGLHPELIADAAKDPAAVKAYVELHIEQGRVLENQALAIGAVSGIAGPLWMKWTITGEAGHAGATPMNLRKDPLMAASEIMQFIESEAKSYPNLVATIGQISVKPGGVNVIPSEAVFTLDLRDIDEELRQQAEENMMAYAQQVCRGRGVEVAFETLQRVAPVPCSEVVQRTIEEACHKLSMTYFSLPSGAGHDGMQFKDFFPIGMIFVRSQDGISHNPAEWSSREDCGEGTELLYETVLSLVNEM